MTRLFLSYGRRDASDLADRLRADLAAEGYDVWQDTWHVQAGSNWQETIADALRQSDAIVALMSPASVRGSVSGARDDDSVCLDELAFARFGRPARPIVPVMAVRCEPPLSIFRLDFVDLTAWRDSPDAYRAGLRRLVDAIGATLGGHVRYRSWEMQLRPWDFAPFLHDMRQHFVGRAWLFKEIADWLNPGAGRDRLLLITGDPGSGKSAIVAELVHRDGAGQLLAYHCCMSDTPETLSPGRFVRSMAAMIAGRLDDYAAALSDPNVEDALSEASCFRDPASAFERGLLAPLSRLKAPEAGVRFLLIDALDEALLAPAAPGTIVDILATRLGRLPSWLRIVATTRNDPDVLKRLAAHRAIRLDADDPRNVADIEQYIDARLTEVTAAGADLATALSRKSAGNFLYVRQALHALGSGADGYHDVDALPPGLFGLYFAFFQRNFPTEESFEATRSVLEVLAASRDRLNEDELSEYLPAEHAGQLPPVLRRLQPYLAAQPGDDAAGLRLFHKSLEDWFTGRELRGDIFYVDKGRGHARIADKGWRDYRGTGALSRYLTAHLPHHLQQSGRWDDLHTLLLDFRYVEKKCASGMSYELLDNYTTLSHESDTLSRFQEFLVRHVHVLAQRPGLLFQLAANQPPSSVAARIARRIWLEGSETRPWLERLNLVERREPILLTLSGHDALLCACRYSPDGRFIASASNDGATRVWNASNGRLLATIHDHDQPAWACSFSPDGERLVVGHKDGRVSVREWRSGDEKGLIALEKGGCFDCSYTSDGKLIGTASSSGVALWDSTTFTKAADVVSGWATAFRPLADGRALICLGQKGVLTVDLGSLETLSVIHSMDMFADAAADGSRVLAGYLSDTGGRLTLYDIVAGAGRKVASWTERCYRCCAVSTRGDRGIVMSTLPPEVSFWNLELGKEVARFTVEKSQSLFTSGCAFSPDDARAAVVSGNTVQIWDADDVFRGGQPSQCHSGPVVTLALSPARDLCVSASELTIPYGRKGEFMLWSLTDGQLVATFGAYRHGGDIMSAAADERARPGAQLRCQFSGDGSHILAGFEPNVSTYPVASFRPHDGERVRDRKAPAGSEDYRSLIYTSGQPTCIVETNERLIAGDSLGGIYIFRKVAADASSV